MKAQPTIPVRIYRDDWQRIRQLAIKWRCSLPAALHRMLNNGNGQMKGKP